jgi:hypothetical protein
VGTAGRILHWDGGTWASSGIGASYFDLYSVWGTAANDVWAAGFASSSAVLLHWNGSAWTQTPFPSDLQFQPLSIWGTAQRIWAVGYNAHFYAYSR